MPTAVLFNQTYITYSTLPNKLREIKDSNKLHSQDDMVGIATTYAPDDWGVGVRVPVGSRIFSSPHQPHQPWGPPNLLFNGYKGFFPWGKVAGA
jgi:hypothetical protein